MENKCFMYMYSYVNEHMYSSSKNIEAYTIFNRNKFQADGVYIFKHFFILTLLFFLSNEQFEECIC